MTEEQIESIKRISTKYQLTAKNFENALLVLAAGYGLNEEQMEQFMSMDENSLMDKHLKMICLTLVIKEPEKKRDSDVDGDVDNDGEGAPLVENLSPLEKLEYTMREHYNPELNVKEPYSYLAHYILNDNQLSASQIEQLRQAVTAKMPEDEIIAMAKNNRQPMEMKRCIEFHEMMRQETKGKKKHWWKR